MREEYRRRHRDLRHVSQGSPRGPANITHGDDEATEIMGSRADISQENPITNDCDDAERDRCCPSLLIFVREMRNNKVSEGSQGITRNGKCLHLCR